jgi:DNA-directed RNA polymerase specialized sigma24 family protein
MANTHELAREPQFTIGILDRVRNGDKAAVGSLLDHFYEPLENYVSRILSGADCRVTDKSDVTNDAFRSFLSWLDSDPDGTLDCSEANWKVLSTIAWRKSWKLRRTQIRRAARLGEIVPASVLQGPDGGGCFDGVADRGLGPEDDEIYKDLFRRCMERLDDERLRQLVKFRLQRRTDTSIAEELGISVARVKQLFLKIEMDWRAMFREEGE